MANALSPPAEDSPAPNLPVDRILLTGFMGSGKSTLGRLLAQRLRWRFLDLDSLIERRAGRTVAAIFAESGEPAFRALETAELQAALRETSAVVALGGGALQTSANGTAIRSTPRTVTVLLTASFETLYDRCQTQAAAAGADTPVRPLLGDPAQARVRLAERDALYRSAATIILDTTGQTADESAVLLLQQLQRAL